ncbi:hypothetical protein Tco_0987915 [Tanacetum coccineum]
MATTDKESSAASTDNRPPMLEESDFESWKIRIERYILGKPLGKLIWKSIKNGPSPHPMITVTTGKGNTINLFTSQYVPPPPQYALALQQAPQSTNDAMLATMNQIVNLLSGFQKQFPPTNYQLRTSTNSMTQATIQAGQITTKNVQRRAPGNKGKHAVTGSQGKVVTCYNCRGQGHVAGAFLADVECTTPYSEPLAITTTTAFKVTHEDAYDSDIDEAPYAAAAFMANLI